MTSIAPTDVDIITESSLTTLSDLTPTDPGDEPPEIRALTAAVDDAAFDLAYERLPNELRVKIGGIAFARYEALKTAKSKKRAWYWELDQAEELLRASKGALHRPISLNIY